jgi:G8 domain
MLLPCLNATNNEMIAQKLLRGMVNVTKAMNGQFVNDTSLSTASSSSISRHLQGDGMKNFTTLTCNANIGTASCQTWTSQFGTANSHNNLLIVPCGVCITMDYSQTEQLDLLGGIDIQGRLVFPDGYQILITTPMIIVQGELIMTSLKPINGVPDVKITMIGQNDKQTFTPIDNNANACNFGSATCTVGKKAIVVAGGKVNST